jgi:hypothetical protein
LSFLSHFLFLLSSFFYNVYPFIYFPWLIFSPRRHKGSDSLRYFQYLWSGFLIYFYLSTIKLATVFFVRANCCRFFVNTKYCDK